ncbi:hypothetical protein RB213_002322 [Colletotrichum asianum]
MFKSRKANPNKDFKPDPKQVAELQKKYTGLEDDLSYRQGHTIGNKYEAYKKAGGKAATSTTTYKATAKPLEKKTTPYDPIDPAFGPVMNKFYTRNSHQILEPLAGAAATDTAFHADRRESFNNRYQDVLVAKSQWEGHVTQAANARASAQKWVPVHGLHHMYSNAP